MNRQRNRTSAPRSRMRYPVPLLVGLAMAAGACTGAEGPAAPADSSDSAKTPTSAASDGGGRIQQPPLGRWKRVTRDQLAPMGERVDLVMPSFTDPTHVTNPLFPVGQLHSAVALGHVDGERLKVETTLLPHTKTIEWNGLRVETLQSQFLAYHDGRIDEVAVDWYAQADDGSVWYFGEDVFIYKDGRVADTLGTWRADIDGPASMIMPADPQVGDAYRTENVPGLVFFEESRVKRTGKTVQGPTGPVDGAMVGQELHFPGEVEDKVFAPEYGEFFSGVGKDVEATAVAVPTDALGGPPPPEGESLVAGAISLFEQASSKEWSVVPRTARATAADWSNFQTQDVPPRLADQMDHMLGRLLVVVDTDKRGRIPHAALDVANAGLDLLLRYQPPVDVDMARLTLWTRQLELDARQKSGPAVLGDITTLEWIRDRVPLEVEGLSSIDDQLRYLRAAAEAHELNVVAEDSARLLKTLDAIAPTA